VSEALMAILSRCHTDFLGLNPCFRGEEPSRLNPRTSPGTSVTINRKWKGLTLFPAAQGTVASSVHSVTDISLSIKVVLPQDAKASHETSKDGVSELREMELDYL
jgi:hypothetical protein